MSNIGSWKRRAVAALGALAVVLSAAAARADTPPHGLPAYERVTLVAFDAAPASYRALPTYDLGAPRPARFPARAILYVLQAYDAVQSAAGTRRGGIERNPLVRPFSHGGIPTYALGFALGDVMRSALLRHTSRELRDGGDELQALANLDGILTTHSSLRGR
jgi:hypothetical protein